MIYNIVQFTFIGLAYGFMKLVDGTDFQKGAYFLLSYMSLNLILGYTLLILCHFKILKWHYPDNSNKKGTDNG